MPKFSSPDQILHLLSRMDEAHMTAAICAAEIRAILLSDARGTLSVVPDYSFRPRLDHSTRTVFWGTQTCQLGPTLLFDLLDRLARRPNQYVCHDQLLADVWKARKSVLTIRSAVRQLKAKLRKAGMCKLAAAIQGRRGYYGLILDLPS
jgi:DNA-binding response OmpR family regulator